jgi:membrane-associated phospholipid phosphatase
MGPQGIVNTPPPRHWPGLVAVAAAYGIGFLLVWGGAHWLTETQVERLPWYFHWETQVPFQAWTLPLYFSMDVLVAIAPFLFRTWRQAAPLMATFLVQLCIAAPFFILIPIEPGFVNDMHSGVWGAYLFEPLGLHNMSQFNHTPSLHVTYALTLALALKQWRPAWTRWLWAVAVCVTTLLVHEHHLVCIAGGLVLYLATAWTVLPFFERRFRAAVT